MIVKFIKIKCVASKTNDVADELVQLTEVREIYTMPGEFDLLIKCTLTKDTDIGEFVQKTIQKIPGVNNTFTMDTDVLFI